MKILVMRITLRASWVHSLKEKRMIVKSVVKRLRNKFNISVSEIDKQDVHKIIVIGIAGILGTSKQKDSTKENIINFIDCNTDAEIINIEEISVY
ncbi:DUF503 domain-containing protein [Clostridium sp. cel8]|jgi:uncharacterized protein|uniref:DUF503 domain-containing protein n=1 Tax=unclassified Clostridium TaxID=2614128 RepID=UPI0015F53E3C|nr:DUF503 domain-containing protein [Clostridium sp. cel8]MBA5850213.1 DUF503 domain-containing protein [Clostridium sp. cel8]